MGKQLGGINGPYVGKIGNVVGYQWRGIWVTRAMPEEFHDAKSERQLEQRGRFKAMVGFAGRLKDILRIGLKQSALKAHKTECNYFQMINKDCLLWDDGALVVDYEHLRLSEGPVAPVAFTGVHEGTLQQEIILDFEKNPEHRNCNGNDRVYVAAVNARREEAVLSLPVYRRMGSITVSLPEYWEGEEVHLYGFVQDIAGRCSESCYLGTAEAIESEEEADSLFHQEFLGGDTRGCGDAEEVGACGPGGDVEGGGETRGGPVKEPVPQDVGGLDMRHG